MYVKRIFFNIAKIREEDVLFKRNDSNFVFFKASYEII